MACLANPGKGIAKSAPTRDPGGEPIIRLAARVSNARHKVLTCPAAAMKRCSLLRVFRLVLGDDFRGDASAVVDLEAMPLSLF
jgi:hypothetical protein